MNGNKRVLVTGSTGFIGSNVSRTLIREGYEVFATRRNSSSLEKCRDIAGDIQWIDIEQADWSASIQKVRPGILIHAAWNGIHEKERNNWDLQFLNFEFSRLVFDAVVSCGVEKIIAIGSQAEYGVSEKPSIESMATSPADAYGAVKLLTCNYLYVLCRKKKIPCYWLRIFSIFGPGDNNAWLIPKVINNLFNYQEIALTEGKQKYDYLFIEDFLECINRIINCKEDFTGIYNICSGRSIEIREILIMLAERIGVPVSLLKFGALSYRDNQNMTIAGDCSKFRNTFGEINYFDLSLALDRTIQYYKLNLKID